MASELAMPLDVGPLRRTSLVVGLLGSAALAYGFFWDHAAAFRSYLWAFCCILSLPLGGMAIVLLQHMTGGGWGVVIRRVLEAATRTIWFVAILFFPLIAGLRDLYLWAVPENVERDPVLQFKSWYLRPDFFFWRAVAYILIWIGMIFIINYWSRLQDKANSPAVERRYRLFAGPALAVYGLTITFASIDWVMSLEPHWISSLYGVLFAIGQILGAFAFGVACVMLLHGRPPFSGVLVRGHLRDFGSLLMAFTMFWMYLAISQYVLIWSANLQEEAPYYIRRMSHGWQYLALAIAVFQFLVPFLLLLSRNAKRDPETLLKVAVLIVVMRFVDLYWLIAPAISIGGQQVFWTDLAAPAALIGLWLFFFLGELTRMPLLPLHVSADVEDDHHV